MFGVINLKIKQVLKFYFGAERADKLANDRLYRLSLSSHDTYLCMEKMLDLIQEKQSMGNLWRYLNDVMDTMERVERQALKKYAFMRFGIFRLNDDERKLIRRSVVKFERHARGLSSYEKTLAIVSTYVHYL